MTQQDIIVWIPTCKRPLLLRTALKSVSQQSAKSRIREIVVIENGLDRRSEEVCREFLDVPIRYVFRDTPLAPGSAESVESMEEWLKNADAPLLALLFDDDWWAPNHLERALEALSQAPDVVASFCSYLDITGESGYLTRVDGAFLPWFASGGSQGTGWWILSLSDLIVASLIATPVHYSSMVVHRRVYLACLAALKDGNPYDSDRALPVELACHGKVVCDRIPTAFIRRHESQESLRLQRSGEAQVWYHHTTQQIFDRAKSCGIDIREEFRSRLDATGIAVGNLKEHCLHGSIDYLVQMKLLDDPLPPRLKTLLRNLTPPFIWDLEAKAYCLIASLMIATKSPASAREALKVG